MKWEDVLLRNDIVDGDLEMQEDRIFYRGPISSIELSGGWVRIEFLWMGRLNINEPGSGWKICDTAFISFEAQSSPPRDIDNGRISFGTIVFEICIIFPKGGSKLDPAKVQGIDLSKIETS